MKKVIVGASLVISSILIIQCNDSSNGNNKKDSTATTGDSTPQKIVTEGGLKDSLATGASDTTKHNDSLQK